MTSNHCDGQMKLYDLSYGEWRRLYKILDRHNTWMDLAEKMEEFDVPKVEDLRMSTDPTRSFLLECQKKAITTTELFIRLSQVHHQELMIFLKPLVEPKYHRLISDSKSSLEKPLIHAEDNTNEKDLKIGLQNFNNVQSVEASGKDCVINNETDKGSQVKKILNNPPQSIPNLVPSNSGNSPAQPDAPKMNNVFKFLYNTTLPEISSEELADATSDWRIHNQLGKGSFGTVFKGCWKQKLVAIKRIEDHGSDTFESYLIQLQRVSRELEMLNSYPSHDNILSLYAYSMGSEAPCLVYPLMESGSLYDRLVLKKQDEALFWARRGEYLTWPQRHNIAKGTAKGLQYLHTVGEIPLIHGNIKSANILLDQNLEPKIGDFGLAQEVPELGSTEISEIRGTWPYLPLEYLQHKTLSTKTDTYSYGIVLFELATGIVAYDNGRPGHKFLKDYLENCEPHNLSLLKDRKGGVENEVFENLIVLGKLCSNISAQQRPEMVSVLEKLC